ncbi:MAG: ion transporter [Eubacterium sp.]|nr:ion transporter [Eubacterium sp.]
MRRRLYEMIEPSGADGSTLSTVYDFVMLVCIVASMVPLAIKQENTVLNVIDKVTVTVFILDYLLRLWTADKKLGKGVKSFVLYPVQPMAVVDLLSILPSLVPINAGFKVLRLFRIVRTFKVFRSFKVFRYSKNITRLLSVLKKQSKSLGAVFSMAVFYVVFTALIMFNIELDTFNSFFDALYWASISLTSVGYGDITPVSEVGRLFTMLSAFVGVAIVALPSGIITAGYLDELHSEGNNE